MPESRPRKKNEYTSPATSQAPRKVRGGRWIAPAMIVCWLLGLAWIVVYYLAPDLPYMSELGNWNLLVGMGLIALGFVFATRWE